MKISVHLLPSLFEPAELAGSVAVILDILRASSTITTALHHGARYVVPFEGIDQALSFRDTDSFRNADRHAGPDQDAGGINCVLLGGERGGVKIEGFDLSNSPEDYAEHVVQGKVIGFTTTNGTRAMLRAAQAQSVIVGCFLNVAAVVSFAAEVDVPIHLICAGTDGSVTGEDVLCAGAIVHGLLRYQPEATLNDSAAMAKGLWMDAVVAPVVRQLAVCKGKDAADAAWKGEYDWLSAEFPVVTGDEDQGTRQHQRDQAEFWSPRVASVMRSTQGGRNLIRLGYSADIVRCGRLDTIGRIPRFDASTSHITLLPR